MEKTNAASAAAEKSGKKKKRSMLEGSPGLSLFLFALPMILGNLFQQFYNMTDSIIVGGLWERTRWRRSEPPIP